MLHSHLTLTTNNVSVLVPIITFYAQHSVWAEAPSFNRTLRGSGHKIRTQGILISNLGPVMDYSRSFCLSSPPSPQISDTASKNMPRNACFQVQIIRHYITCAVERRHSINQDLADNRKDEMGGV
jgi:hypothetical protein